MKISSHIILLVFSLLSSSCSRESIPKSKIKNVILLIGDGMGYQQLNLANLYLSNAPSSKFRKKQLTLFKKVNKTAISLVRPHGKLVVDSACSATQLATGEPALSEAIAVNYQGEKSQTILELAKTLGKSTALISNVRITHATPASFASHTTSRHLENEIAEHLLKTDVDIMVSGGLRHFLPQNYKGDDKFRNKWKKQIELNYGHSSKRKDDLNLLDQAVEQKYQVSFNAKDYINSNSSKHLALLSNSRMPFAIDLAKDEISIPQITTATLNKLEKNPKGFFLMVEEGLIDWAGHANDAGTMLHEVLQMDKTLENILAWAKDRDDTLIIVTADHETGGFGFSYKNRDIPQASKYPGEIFQNRSFVPGKNYGGYEILDSLYNQKKSFANIFGKELQKSLNKNSLCSSVKDNTGIDLPLHFCQEIITEGKALQTMPKDEQAQSFHREYHHNFTNPHLEMLNMLGKAISPYQNIVWATGSHTSTPVGVFLWGLDDSLEKFPEVMTHTQLGKLMKTFIE